MIYEFKYSALLPSNTSKLDHSQPIDVTTTTTECVDMAYIQEISAVVVVFQSGAVFTYKRDLGEGKQTLLSDYTFIFMMLFCR